MRTFVDIWNGMEPAGRQAPNSTPPPPLLPAVVGASSHPLQLVGEMEVGATATTTYYGVTQQLLEQEALPSCLSRSQLSHALFVAMYKLYKLHKLYKLYKLQCTSPKLLVTHLSPYGWLA